MINRNLIQQAKEVNLKSLLETQGFSFKKHSQNSWECLQHNSLIIGFGKNGLWNFSWFSKSLKGDVIEFVMAYFGFDFKKTVSFLTNTNFEEAKKEKNLIQTANLEQGFKLPNMSSNMQRAFAYLIKTRCIDTSIVQNLAKNKLLMQDNRGNIVFPWYDSDERIVGAELHGTLTEKRFKGIVSLSAYGYGYNVSIGNPTDMYIFESAIDLLSFWSLNNSLNNALLVSMAGLKDEVVEGFIMRSTTPLNIYICTDNDSSGHEFYEKLKIKLNCPLSRLLSDTFKDWNELLKSKYNI